MSEVRRAPRFVETETFNTIWTFANLVLAMRKSGAVIGPKGIGKTTALHEIKNRVSGSLILEATESNQKNTKIAYDNILRLLTDNDWLTRPRMREDRMEETIAESLCEFSESGGLLIIDEAQHLRLEILRALSGYALLYEVPILFVGNPQLLKTGKQRGDAFQQATDRIIWCPKIEGSPKDFITVAVAAGVRGEDAFQLIENFGNETKSLRRLEFLLEAASIGLTEDAPILHRHLLGAMPFALMPDQKVHLKVTPAKNGAAKTKAA